MAKGFDGSRPDIGAFETEVTVENRSTYDARGMIASGMASDAFLQILLDDEFWDIDPGVTNVATVGQAIQSRILAEAEVGANEIRRQRYLRRASTLSRFADLLQLRAHDLTVEEFRRRLLDTWLAYHGGGSTQSYQRVIGAFTGLPAFFTRVDKFPGYMVIGRSYITPAHVVSPTNPVDGVEVTSVAGDTLSGTGFLRLTATEATNSLGNSQVFLYIAWQAPGETSFGEPQRIYTSGRYAVPSSTALLTANVLIETDELPDIPFEDGLTYPIAVAEWPDTYQEDQNWLPSREDLRHGIVAEVLGLGHVSSDEYDELMATLKNVADFGPLRIIEYDLEEPGLTLAASAIAAAWATAFTPSFVTAYPALAPTFGYRYQLSPLCDEEYDPSILSLHGSATALCFATGISPCASASALCASATALCSATGLPASATAFCASATAICASASALCATATALVIPPGLSCVPSSATALFPPSQFIYATDPDGNQLVYAASATAFSDVVDVTATCAPVKVPIYCGPFVVIKERFHDYEKASADNTELGPTFYWAIENEIVAQPSDVTGVLLTEVSADMLSGSGRLYFDPESMSLLWQAPSPTDADGLDPLGSGATLTVPHVQAEQPELISGVVIESVSTNTQAGAGLLHYRSSTQSLAWQAPGDLQPGPFQPVGATTTRLILTSSTSVYSMTLRAQTNSLPIVDIVENIDVSDAGVLTGVSMIGVSAATKPGDGEVSYTAATVTESAKLSWRVAGDISGAETPITSSGSYILTSASGSRLYVEVNLPLLPELDTQITVTVTGLLIEDGGDFTISSGNPLYSLGLRVLLNQLPENAVSETINVRSAGLTTQPVLTTSMSASTVDVSLLDRVVSENVVRRFYQRQGESTDTSDPSWGEYEELDGPFDTIELSKPYIEFKIQVEDSEQHIGFPRREDYEFVAIAMRPRIEPPDPGCYITDDFYRVVTWGLDADCDLYTDFGVVSGGLDGFMTSVFSRQDAPDGFL